MSNLYLQLIQHNVNKLCLMKKDITNTSYIPVFLNHLQSIANKINQTK